MAEETITTAHSRLRYHASRRPSLPVVRSGNLTRLHPMPILPRIAADGGVHKVHGDVFSRKPVLPALRGRTEDIAAGRTTRLFCPRCNVAMMNVQVAGTPLEECSHCGGLWVNIANFDRICSDTEAQTAATGLQMPPPVPFRPGRAIFEMPAVRQADEPDQLCRPKRPDPAGLPRPRHLARSR